MRGIRFLLKIVLLPVIGIVTIIQWFFIFLIGFSSIILNSLAGLSLLIAVLSYLMRISNGTEVLGLIAIGFVIFMIPIIGVWIVTHLAIFIMTMRNIIRS